MKEVNTSFDNCELVLDGDVLSIIYASSYQLSIGVDTIVVAGDHYGLNSQQKWVYVPKTMIERNS